MIDKMEKINIGIGFLILTGFLLFCIPAVFGSPTATFVSPTPANNENRSWNYTYINITSDENLNQSFLEWGNSSGFTNVSMDNSSLTNWYVNMTSLAEYNYNYTVWAQNTTENWNQSIRQYVTIDLNNPVISFVSPVANYNSSSANINFTFNVTDTLSSLLNCSIYINGTLNATNSTTMNGTDTTFSLTGLSEANNQNWTINCTDDSNRTHQPSVRNFNVDLTAPVIILITANNTNSSDATPDLQFNVTDNLDTSIFCELFINNTGYGTNSSVTNATTTTITANTSLSDGSYEWYVNCTDDASNVGQSETRTINIAVPAVAVGKDDEGIFEGVFDSLSDFFENLFEMDFLFEGVGGSDTEAASDDDDDFFLFELFDDLFNEDDGSSSDDDDFIEDLLDFLMLDWSDDDSDSFSVGNVLGVF